MMIDKSVNGGRGMKKLHRILHDCTCHLPRLAVAVLTVVTGSCSVGPDYNKPSVETPATYKEMEGWKTATPQDEQQRGHWWEIYNDPQLNTLEEQVSVSNQNIKIAVANYQQAEALVSQMRASYFPTVSLQASDTREKNAALSTTNTNASHNLNLGASWEPDLWGQLRRQVESSEASAQASAGDLESAKLSAQAALAIDYYQLCMMDSAQKLLNDSVAAYQKSLAITENQYRAGVAAKSDVMQAETQLKSTQAQAIDVGVQRAQTEHAIALLVGKSPSTFSLATMGLSTVAPSIPPALPSQLLERRPDIAAAERRMAAANAQIGVQKAAYFPLFTLSAAGGFQSANASNWLTAPNRLWSVGATLSETLFDAGARSAKVDQAQASYDGSVASYRQTVLNGYGEVEDNLAALRILAQETQAQDGAAHSAEQSLDVITHQYNAGIVSYLNVVVAQTTALANERNALAAHAQQMTASVSLIMALGGLWEPTTKKD
jgi:NodT family efflux transporter outer membrane factor (OMF) lipoprotein